MGMEALGEEGATLGDRRVESESLRPAPVRGLRAVERALVERFGAALQGRVLLVGCSVGRFTTQLSRLAYDMHGACGAAEDVASCRRAYPHAVFTQCDARDLGDFAARAFDAVVVQGTALDPLDEDERCAALGDVRELLAYDGLLIFFSRNRDGTVRRGRRLRGLLGSPRHSLRSGLSRETQERQLSDLGYELLECVDHDGHGVVLSASPQRTGHGQYTARA
jgi:SAM-dependent methyltransferase